MDSNHNSKLFSGKSPGDVNKLEIINVKRFLQSRCGEIEEMLEILKKNDKQERVFQKLPFVMRRRAMSHNPFKIPKNIRIHILKEMAKNAPKACKRIRKDKRKRLNRVEEYQQRYNKNKWLETHLYHAKRFKMDSIWGYRLALTSTQKSKRRFLRYLKQRCVIHDRSYMEVLSVSGKLDDFKSCFKNIFSDYYLMFQKVYTSGSIRGSCFCYSPISESLHQNGNTDINHESKGAGMNIDQPNGNIELGLGDIKELIGPVNYLWLPKKESEEARTIWLFIHPVSISQLFSILSQNKELEVNYVNNLVKFELFGPFSLMLLKKVIKVDSNYSESNRFWDSLDYNSFNISNSFTLPLFINVPKVYGNCKLSSWLPTGLKETYKTTNLKVDTSKLNEDRLKFYEYKSTSAQINVNNLLRVRRRKDYSKLVSKLLESLSTSPKTKNVNNGVKGEYDEDQKEQADAEDDMSLDENKIPILVIFRNTQPFGVDVLMPSNSNGSQLWILLNRNGGLSFGLQERELMMNYYQVCSFPQDFPETELGQRYYKDLLRCYPILFENEMIKYVLRPANKRVNYSFLGVDNAFALPVNLDDQKLNFTLDLPDQKNFRGSQGSVFKSRHLLLTSLCSGSLRLIFINTLGLYHFPRDQHMKVLRLTNFPYNRHNLFVQKLLDKLIGNFKENEKLDNNVKNMLNCGTADECYVVVKLTSFKGSFNRLSRLYKVEMTDLNTIPIDTLKRIGNKNFTLKSYMRIKEPFHDEFKIPNLKTRLQAKKSKTLDQAVIQKVFNDFNKQGIQNSRELIGFLTSKDTVNSGVGCVKLKSLMDSLSNTLLLLKDDKFNGRLNLSNIKTLVWFRDRDSREYYLGTVSLVIHDVLTGIH